MLLVTQQKVHELLKRRDPRERNCDWVFEKLMMRWQQCKPGIAFHVALPKLASPVVNYCPRMEKNASEPVKRGKGIQCKLRCWFEANTWEGKHVKVPRVHVD